MRHSVHRINADAPLLSTNSDSARGKLSENTKPMDHGVTQPVLIPSVDADLENEQCSYDVEDWQELEQFWDEERIRIQEADGRANLHISSSLEEHLLHDDYLEEPQSRLKRDKSPKILKGEDVQDIPTSYIVSGFQPHEFVAIGTYVDKGILPGFRYRVRKNLTDEYLFDGEAKYLESVGLGYGKRLTFEGESLNENDNFFWSDSRVHGYGFQLQAFEKADVFSILDTQTERVIGRVIVSDPSLSDHVLLSTSVGERGYIEREVEVYSRCDVILNDSSNIFLGNVTLRGNAVLVREGFADKAKVSQIIPSDFVIDSCLLLPED